LLLVKRLIYILFIVILISVGFLFLNNMIYRVDHSFSNRYENEDIQTELQSARSIAVDSVQKYTILYSDESPADRAVCDNICAASDAMKLNYERKQSVTVLSLADTDTLIIACREFTDKVSPLTVADYVIGGGRVLFAVGLSEDTTAAYLYPVWGLMEKGNLYDAQGIDISEGFFPSGALSFEGNVLPLSTTSIRLNDGCEIYARAGDGNPVVWVRDYREGRVGVINCNMMEDKAAVGFFTAALAATQESLVYPVVGTKAAFLDGFPPSTHFSSEMLLAFYGRDSNGFVRDILWPSLLKKALDGNFGFTAFFMGLTEYDTASRMLNESDFAYHAKEVLRYSGEIAAGGDHSTGEHDYTGQAHFVRGVMTTIFRDYTINCYAPIYGKLSDADIEKLKEAFLNLKVIRGTYFGDPDTQEVQIFGVRDGLVTYPYITAGFAATERNRMEYYSLLTAYGTVSHSFNMLNVINPSSEADDWENIEDDYGELCDEFFAAAPWLQSVTASEGARFIETYSMVHMEVAKDAGILRAACTDFVSGQVFLARSENPLAAVQGCSVEAVGKNFYKVTAEGPYFELKEGD